MNSQLLESAIRTALGEKVQSFSFVKGEACLTVPADHIVEVMAILRENPALRFEQLMDICGVDYPDRPQRFEVVYHLLSLTHNHRLRIKVITDEKTPVPSVTALWKVASWFEREAFDLFGILFSGHADLRRILTDYNFSDYPMRKGYPLTGRDELRYDPEQKRVVYEPVKLTQDFRRFDFLSPWEGMTDVMLPGDEKATKLEGEKKG